jgi:hypothetical protein
MTDAPESRRAAERRAAEERLARALRDNLRRRKAQSEARAARRAAPLAPPAPSGKNPAD